MSLKKKIYIFKLNICFFCINLLRLGPTSQLAHCIHLNKNTFPIIYSKSCLLCCISIIKIFLI